MNTAEARLPRRKFLRLALAAGLGAAGLTAACTTAPPPSPTARPTEPPKPAATVPPAAKPAASPVAQASPAARAGVERLKVGSVPLVAYAGFFVAADKGYFREQNLEVEFVEFPGAAQMAQPLSSGQIDIANADPSAAFLNALARGIPLRFVADGNHTEPGHSILAWVIRKDLVESGAIKDLPDLKGKRLSGVGRGSLVDSLAHRTLAKAGLKPTDVDLQYVSFPENLPALANKALDGAILVEPLVTGAVGQGIGVRWRGMDDLFGRFQSTVIMYGPSMANRQDAGRRFLVAYLKGVRDYVDAFKQGKDRDAIVQILIKNTSVKDAALYSRMVMPGIDPNGTMDVPSVKELQQWYVDNGFVEKPADLDRAFDTSFLEYALGQLGRR